MAVNYILLATFRSLNFRSQTYCITHWTQNLFRDHIIPLENTGTQELSRIDVDIAQDFDLWGGTLSIDADWTHYLSFERNKPGSDEIEELIGTYRYPENVANLRVG